MYDCSFCHDSVDPDDETKYELVTSWVTGPKLDHPVLRSRQGIYAHKRCIDLERDGQAPDQLSLEI